MIKIAFIGLGSIAKRHIYNLAIMLNQRDIVYQIDVYRHNDTKIQNEIIDSFVSGVYKNTEWGNIQYDIVFITNPTALHFDTIKKCVNHTRHMFIEKPVFSNPFVNLDELSLNKNYVYYVACPLRYTKVLQFIKENIDLSKVYSVRAISSSYLPEWRPEVDYRNTYSAHRDMGGGVAQDLVHEWDYLTFLFGFPEKVLYAGGKFSALEIESDDLATYIGVYPNKIIELHLDYFGQEPMREVILFMKEETVRVDFINSSIIFEKSGNEIHFDEKRNEYQRREIEHFLNIVDGHCKNDDSIEHAVRVLSLTSDFAMEEEK